MDDGLRHNPPVNLAVSELTSKKGKDDGPKVEETGTEAM
jgi:hypothetical protein